MGCSSVSKQVRVLFPRLPSDVLPQILSVDIWDRVIYTEKCLELNIMVNWVVEREHRPPVATAGQERR